MEWRWFLEKIKEGQSERGKYTYKEAVFLFKDNIILLVTQAQYL